MGFVRLLPWSTPRPSALSSRQSPSRRERPRAGDLPDSPAPTRARATGHRHGAARAHAGPGPEGCNAGATGIRVIAFANQKGGVAKTTTTLNLGVAFKELGYRVLLVDLDPQGNLTMSQGLNPDTIETSMFDVLVRKIPISDVIERREVDLAVSSIDLAGAELALSALIGRERSLERRSSRFWTRTTSFSSTRRLRSAC